MRNLPQVVAAAIAVCTLSFVAPADAGANKAWTAAKAAMPADTSVAIGIDVTAVAKSATFEKLFPIALGKDAQIKQGFDLFKVACKMDPFVVIHGMAVGLDATQSDGAIFIHIADFNPQKLETCLQQVAKAKGAGAKADSVSMTTKDGVTELTNEGAKLYFGWLNGDVLVMVPKHLEDRAALKTWMGGGFGKGALGKMMGKVNTSSAVFVASTAGKSIDATHNLKQGYGWITLSGANMAMEFHGDLGDAAAAKGLATDATTQVQQLRDNPPLPAIADMLKNVTVTPAATEIVLKASVVEKDFADLVALLLSSMGSGN